MDASSSEGETDDEVGPGLDESRRSNCRMRKTVIKSVALQYLLRVCYIHSEQQITLIFLWILGFVYVGSQCRKVPFKYKGIILR